MITSVVSSTRNCIACALNDLSDDRISFFSTDNENLQVFIQDYFNESATEDSGSDDEKECSKEFSDFTVNLHFYGLYIDPPVVCYTEENTEVDTEEIES